MFEVDVKNHDRGKVREGGKGRDGGKEGTSSGLGF